MTASTIGAPATATYVDAFLRLTVIRRSPRRERSSSTWTWKTLCPILATKTLPETPPDHAAGHTQVLVTDGGTVVIGGVIQTQNSLAISQVPLLGDIPYWATCSSIGP